MARKEVEQKVKNKKLKQIPRFNSEEEEAKFWDTHDTTEYFDTAKPVKMVFPNLKPTTKTITLRIPMMLLNQIKIVANKKDVPYQSLMKVFLSERVKEEYRSA